LLELMLVIALIALGLTVSWKRYVVHDAKVQEQRLKQSLTKLRSVANNYFVTHCNDIANLEHLTLTLDDLVDSGMIATKSDIYALDQGEFTLAFILPEQGETPYLKIVLSAPEDSEAKLAGIRARLSALGDGHILSWQYPLYYRVKDPLWLLSFYRLGFGRSQQENPREHICFGLVKEAVA